MHLNIFVSVYGFDFGCMPLTKVSENPLVILDLDEPLIHSS